MSTNEKTPPLQVLAKFETRGLTRGWTETLLGTFDSRADALDAIAKDGKAGVQYLIAEAEPKCIEEQTRVSRKLV